MMAFISSPIWKFKCVSIHEEVWRRNMLHAQSRFELLAAQREAVDLIVCGTRNPFWKMPSRILFLLVRPPVVTICIENAFPGTRDEGRGRDSCCDPSGNPLRGLDNGAEEEKTGVEVVRWFLRNGVLDWNGNFCFSQASIAVDGFESGRDGVGSGSWDAERGAKEANSLNVEKFRPNGEFL